MHPDVAAAAPGQKPPSTPPPPPLSEPELQDLLNTGLRASGHSRLQCLQHTIRHAEGRVQDTSTNTIRV